MVECGGLTARLYLTVSELTGFGQCSSTWLMTHTNAQQHSTGQPQVSHWGICLVSLPIEIEVAAGCCCCLNVMQALWWNQARRWGAGACVWWCGAGLPASSSKGVCESTGMLRRALTTA